MALFQINNIICSRFTVLINSKRNHSINPVFRAYYKYPDKSEGWNTTVAMAGRLRHRWLVKEDGEGDEGDCRDLLIWGGLKP
nr:hypothetical protein Iba_chr08fCG3830 [Ipomoea batatas]